ncbi:MAG: helix-hairpin-helix domain-containing protein [Bacteroidota bacterium]
MTRNANITLPLTSDERTALRRQKVRIRALAEHSVSQLSDILSVSPERARYLRALAEFQQIPSIGIRFAEDLIFLGYYSLAELQDKDGAHLVEEFERRKGFWIDSCVEDQFRLAVHFAHHQDMSKQWWDFTAERKAYRAEFGYPADRPLLAWHEG